MELWNRQEEKKKDICTKMHTYKDTERKKEIRKDRKNEGRKERKK
jgi:hypothetical protein